MDKLLQQCANYIILILIPPNTHHENIKTCPKGMHNNFVELLDRPRLVSTYKIE
jgi:hypothetical protein